MWKEQMMRKKGGIRIKSKSHDVARDLTSDLPDDILQCIISSLSVGDVFRTSILSKRWRHLYKSATRVDFDWTCMKRLKRRKITHEKYDEIVNTTLNNHSGNLSSCSFKHLPQSLGLGDVNSWVEFVIETKKITSLSLECESSRPSDKDHKFLMVEFKPMMFSNLFSLELTNYHLQSPVLSAFKGCDKLKVLKLEKVLMESSLINAILENCCGLEKFSLIESEFYSLKIEHQNIKCLELLRLEVYKILYVNVKSLHNLVIDSLMCPPKGLRICNLSNFSYSCNSISNQEFLKTQDILENCSDLLRTGSTNIFLNLLSLSIDLDLNNIREALALSYALLSCVLLNTLEITIPIENASKSRVTYNDCDLPYSNSMLWEKREEHYFVLFNKLKFVKVKGFTGKEYEEKFVKLLITKANIMEKMHIICDSKFMDKARELLALPRGSSCLNIVLKSK